MRALVPVLCMMLNALEQLMHRPVPLLCGGSGPQGEDMKAVGPGCTGRRWVAMIDQLQRKRVTQHLERGELTDEVRIDRAAGEELQDAADVRELPERIPIPAGGPQFAPEADEHSELIERLLSALRVWEEDREIVRAAWFTIGKQAGLAVAPVPERHEL